MRSRELLRDEIVIGQREEEEEEEVGVHLLDDLASSIKGDRQPEIKSWNRVSTRETFYQLPISTRLRRDTRTSKHCATVRLSAKKIQYVFYHSFIFPI